MKTVASFPVLCAALMIIGSDSDMEFIPDAALPDKWIKRFDDAEFELSNLSPQELETFCIGEETESEPMRKARPIADSLLSDAFEGDLNDVLYKP
jgi:hypothetical protein